MIMSTLCVHKIHCGYSDTQFLVLSNLTWSCLYNIVLYDHLLTFLFHQKWSKGGVTVLYRQQIIILYLCGSEVSKYFYWYFFSLVSLVLWKFQHSSSHTLNVTNLQKSSNCLYRKHFTSYKHSLS